MNPPLTQSAALTQLKLLTSQTAGSGNFTFTDDELTQALQTAWNDTYVVRDAWDSSLSYTDGTYEYAIPATVTSIRDLYYTRTTTDYPERLDPKLYEVDLVAGKIRFQEYAQTVLSTGMTIYIKGWYKIASTDSLTTQRMVNYVIWHAAEILLSNLMFKKAFYFLKTDTTMADIARALQMAQSNTLRYKQALSRAFESM